MMMVTDDTSNNCDYWQRSHDSQGDDEGKWWRWQLLWSWTIFQDFFIDDENYDNDDKRDNYLAYTQYILWLLSWHI